MTTEAQTTIKNNAPLPFKRAGFWPFTRQVTDGWQDLGKIHGWTKWEDGETICHEKPCATCKGQMRVGRIDKTQELFHYCPICLLPFKPNFS